MKRVLVPVTLLFVAIQVATMLVAAAPASAVPAEVNWVTRGKVGPVRDTGQCGSTWAFSATSAVASRYAIENKTAPLQPSDQELLDCSDGYGNQGCDGGLMDQAFQYMIAHGISSQNAYPYTASTGPCEAGTTPRALRVNSFQTVAENNETALLKAVALGPVSAAVDGSSSSWQFYSGGIITGTQCGTQLDKGVLIVGYGTLNGQPYWLVQNDWGTTWGERGYAKIARGTGSSSPGACGIAMAASYPTGVTRW